MKLTELQQIKAVYDGINQGISNPILINTAYTYLNNTIDGAPIRAKIQAITRFMMLSYVEVLKEVLAQIEASHQQQILKSREESYKTQYTPEVDLGSIGTMETKPKQSHQESFDINDIQDFLTKAEKESLSDNTSGTELIVERDGKKKRTRSPNGTHKARR